MHDRKKKAAIAALSALLCVPFAFGVLAGCGGSEGGSEGGGPEGGGPEGGQPETGDGYDTTPSVAQSTVTDASPVGFFSLGEVEITHPYAVNGLDKEIDYLLKLDADRLLADFRANAKLSAKSGKTAYDGGWEGALIGGHTLGHYLSAIAQAYANAGTSAQDKAALAERIDYMVGELKECQDHAVAAGANAGFLWGAKMIGSKPEIQFDNVEKGRTNIETEAWVPWYTMHKILAGLIDLYNLAGNETALEIATKLGDWTYERVSKWSAETRAQVLSIEYGGMNDCLYNLYAITKDPNHAIAAHKFDEDVAVPGRATSLFADIMAGTTDYLNNRHANTTIPKIVGALNGYIQMQANPVDGVDTSTYLDLARKFWTTVKTKHTYVTGGNSEWEHFGRDNILDGERTNANCETCNTYNMLKLSRTLFALQEDKTVKNLSARQYLDYYENTYLNAIWSSQNPETGMTTYFQPMASGYFKVYSTEEHNFWCCTGSGMESFTKLNDSIYYDGGNSVYVSMYLSSELKTEDVSITAEAELEDSDVATFTVTDGATTLRLRRPDWSSEFHVDLNGEGVVFNEHASRGDKFISVDVEEGDVVKVYMKKSVVAYDLPDKAGSYKVYAFKYGPYVLSAELGSEAMETGVTGVNVTIPAKAVKVRAVEVAQASEGGDAEAFTENIDEYMVKNPDGTFTLTGSTSGNPYRLSYHYKQYQQRYAIYLPIADYGTVIEEIEPWTWETTDTVQPGYGQYENDSLHEMTEGGSGSVSVTSDGTYRYARANGTFTYRVAVNKEYRNRLVVYLRGADAGKTLLIRSGSTVLYRETLNRTGTGEYSVYVDIPDSVVQAAEHVSIPVAGQAAREYDVISVTFGGIDGAESAKVCSFLYSQAYTYDGTDAHDPAVAYYVNCGDYDVYTLNAGEKLGMNQSVTEQVYGADPVTGKKWGIVDGYQKTWDGAAPQGVYTNSTWACENPAWPDGSDKAVSNRYTKNQSENSLARKISYRFDLEDGTYRVRMFFVRQWDASGAPNVSANGTSVVTNGDLGKEIVFNVTVSDGELLLDCTTSAAALNIAYIIIEFA